MRIAVFFYALLFFLTQSSCIAPDAYAAYAGNPLRVFNPDNEERDCALFTEAVSDIIYDRGSKSQSDDMRVDFYGATAGLALKNRCLIYAGLGAAKVEEEYLIRGENVKWQTGYGFTWLAGAAFRVYKKELKSFYNSILLVGFDGQYRNTDFDPDVIRIGPAEYNIPHTDITHSSIEYNDWQLALSCALKISAFSPYAGFRYSDFESCARVTRGSLIYQNDNAEAENNFGIFMGISINAIDSLCANIEAGFIDENSISASLSWSF